MSLFSRFFSRKEPQDADQNALISGADTDPVLSLQVLFADRCPQDSAKLVKVARSYHPSMREARWEIDPELGREGKCFGLAGWGQHVIRLVGFDLPMPKAAVEQCVQPAHFDQERKAQIRAHKAHLILLYNGHEKAPVERFVALGCAAGVLAQFGAVGVLNEAAHTALPGGLLADPDISDALEFLRTMPLPLLFCGFVKCQVEGVPGIWMRTYGASRLGWSDLAVHASGHDQGQRYLDMFSNIMSYLRDSGAEIAAGHTLQIDTEVYLRFREPSADEPFLEGEEPILVVEEIGPDEINRQVYKPE